MPYNQPSAAFDLVTRFLSKKSFIDDEMTQIRAPNHGSNKKKDEDTSSSSLFMMNEVAPPASASSSTLGLPSNSSSTDFMSHMHVALFSFLAGLFFAGVAMRLQNSRSRRSQRANYERIPDTAGAAAME